MPRQNLIFTVGITGLLLSVSVSVWAAYGTDASVSGYGTCPSSTFVADCPPPTYYRPVYDGTQYLYGLSHSYDSSGLYSNIGTGNIYHPGNINGSISYPTSGVMPPFSAPAITVIGTGGSGGALWSTGGESGAAAGVGHLHARARATADLISGLIGSDPTVAATANATAQASWYDALHIISSTLNPGTPVQLHGILRLDGYLSITNPSGTSDLSLTATSDNAQGTFGILWQSNQYGSDSASCAATNFGGALPCMQEYTIYTVVGDTITLRGVLTASAFANAGRNVIYYPDSNPHGPFPGSRAAADFYNTGFITLESLTAGATFTTDSGASYSIVPVPAAVWLFGSGLLGLVGVARRRVHVSRHRGHEGNLQAASSGLRPRRSGEQDQDH